MIKIPEDEFLNRVDEIKKFVSANGVGALIVFSTSRSHIWYQTGHVGYISNWSNRDRVSDTVVVVPEKGDPVLLVSGLPYIVEKVREVSWIKDVRIVSAKDPRAAAIPGMVKDFGTEALAILHERGLQDKKVGLVGVESMPVPVYESLVSAFSFSNIEFTDDIVSELRSRKSSAEVSIMKEAARLSDSGFETLLKTAKPGMQGYEVIAKMEETVRAQGADYVQFWMASGPADSRSISSPDIKPHKRRLGKDDQITCCSYVVYEGYWAHAMRTGTLGGVSPQQERIFPSCIKIHRSAIEMMKPGASVSEIVKNVRKMTEESGMELHSPRIGHGIGLDYGEMPFINENNSELLKSGMIVELHTQFVIPGTGGFYVPLGDVCCVNDDGVEVLTRFPQGAFRI